MSARQQDLRPTVGLRADAAAHGVEAAIVLVLGFSLMLARLGVHGRRALIELAAIYLALFAVSLGARVPVEGAAPLRCVLVLFVGVGAVFVSAFGAGRALPLGAGAGALALNTAAAISEEAFFRRFLYGRLAGFGVPVAIAGSAFLFALVHVPAHGIAAFWLDLGAGLVLSWQRWASGSWQVPAATHAIANLVAVLR